MKKQKNKEKNMLKIKFERVFFSFNQGSLNVKPIEYCYQ